MVNPSCPVNRHIMGMLILSTDTGKLHRKPRDDPPPGSMKMITPFSTILHRYTKRFQIKGLAFQGDNEDRAPFPTVFGLGLALMVAEENGISPLAGDGEPPPQPVREREPG